MSEIKDSDLIFSTGGNKEQERRLNEYFQWLQTNYSALNPSQLNDLRAMNMKVRFRDIQAKQSVAMPGQGSVYDTRTAEEKLFMQQYGMSNNEFANMTFLEGKDQLDLLTNKGRGTLAGPFSPSVPVQSGKIEEINPVQGPTVAGTTPQPNSVYKYTDSTGKVNYYYVLNTKRINKVVNSVQIPYAKPVYKAESILVPPDGPLGGPPPRLGPSASKGIKPTANPKIWHSADYQEIFTKDLEAMTIMLLGTAENALSTYDYRTIQYLSGVSSPNPTERSGRQIEVEYPEEESLTNPTFSPGFVNSANDFTEKTIKDIESKIRESVSGDYIEFLKLFGSIPSGTTSFTRYLPSYNKNGQAKYNVSLEVVDSDFIIGYNVYIVEEDGAV